MNGIEKKNTKKTEYEKGGFFYRLKSGLKKTRNSLADGINRVVDNSAEIGPEFWQELEEILSRLVVAYEDSSHGFFIELTATGSAGCDSTIKSDTITVWHRPDAGFTLSDTALCPISGNGATITFNDTTFGEPVYFENEIALLKMNLIIQSVN